MLGKQHGGQHGQKQVNKRKRRGRCHQRGQGGQTALLWQSAPCTSPACSLTRHCHNSASRLYALLSQSRACVLMPHLTDHPLSCTPSKSSHHPIPSGPIFLDHKLMRAQITLKCSHPAPCRHKPTQPSSSRTGILSALFSPLPLEALWGWLHSEWTETEWAAGA